MASLALLSTISRVVASHTINGRTVGGGTGIVGEGEPRVTGITGFGSICCGASRAVRGSTVVGSRVDAGIVGEGEPRITCVTCLGPTGGRANSTLRNSTVLR